jgi:hypothetical protein
MPSRRERGSRTLGGLRVVSEWTKVGEPAEATIHGTTDEHALLDCKVTDVGVWEWVLLAHAHDGVAQEARDLERDVV